MMLIININRKIMKIQQTMLHYIFVILGLHCKLYFILAFRVFSWRITPHLPRVCRNSVATYIIVHLNYELIHICRWRSKRWWTSLHKNSPLRSIEGISKAAASHATRAISLSSQPLLFLSANLPLFLSHPYPATITTDSPSATVSVHPSFPIVAPVSPDDYRSCSRH